MLALLLATFFGRTQPKTHPGLAIRMVACPKVPVLCPPSSMDELNLVLPPLIGYEIGSVALDLISASFVVV